jgi:hypothetical protein
LVGAPKRKWVLRNSARERARCRSRRFPITTEHRGMPLEFFTASRGVRVEEYRKETAGAE